MADQDKYGIQDAIDKHFQGQSFHDLRDKYYQQKLTLPNGIWYLERASGGYYILPVYRNARRFLTRLDADVAANLILSFDAYIGQRSISK